MYFDNVYIYIYIYIYINIYIYIYIYIERVKKISQMQTEKKKNPLMVRMKIYV